MPVGVLVRRKQVHRTSVLLVDSNDKLATLIAQLLADEPSLRVVGVVKDAGAAVRVATQEQPNVVLVDTKLRDVPTLALCSALRAVCAATLLLWLSEPDPVLARSPYVDGTIERGLTLRELVETILETAAATATRTAPGG